MIIKNCKDWYFLFLFSFHTHKKKRKEERLLPLKASESAPTFIFNCYGLLILQSAISKKEHFTKWYDWTALICYGHIFCSDKNTKNHSGNHLGKQRLWAMLSCVSLLLLLYGLHIVLGLKFINVLINVNPGNS